MTDLEELITFWEAFLDLRNAYEPQPILARVEMTIRKLKELKKLKGE